MAASQPPASSRQATIAAGALGWNGIAYGAGLFVAIAVNTTTYATSPDGITWTTRSLPAAMKPYNIAYGAGIFLVIGDQGSSTTTATSPDGLNWTTNTTTTAIIGVGFGYGNQLFLAFGGAQLGNGVNICNTTPDGVTWTTSNVPTIPNVTGYVYWQAVCYGNNRYVVVNNTTPVTFDFQGASSPDGMTWTGFAMPAIAASIAYGNGIFVATGATQYVSPTSYMTSTNGTSWSTHSLTNIGTVTFGGGVFFMAPPAVAAGTATKTWMSTNGTLWTSSSAVGAGAHTNYTAYGNNRFVTVTNNSNLVNITIL
ncbi:unnamed protein product [Sphagnum tenellum]